MYLLYVPHVNRIPAFLLVQYMQVCSKLPNMWLTGAWLVGEALLPFPIFPE